MSILVVAQLNGNELDSSVFAVVKAAQEIGGDIDLLICADGASVAQYPEGVAKVLVANNSSFAKRQPEDVAAQVLSVAGNYKYILAGANTFGKAFMPRVAAKLDVFQISDITSVESADSFERPIYAGNANEVVKSSDDVKVITVRPSAFEKVSAGGSPATEDVAYAGQKLSEFVKEELTESDRPDLTAAEIVVSGGRGVGSKEGFDVIEKFADKLGAAVGSSRAAVDAGYAPNDYQVGQTGKIVAPNLYIAAGISGAIQHLAGMKNSKIIVAINIDDSAPIFEIADFGLVGDLFEELPKIEALL